jgi:hypothetical protein
MGAQQIIGVSAGITRHIVNTASSHKLFAKQKKSFTLHTTNFDNVMMQSLSLQLGQAACPTKRADLLAPHWLLD